MKEIWLTEKEMVFLVLLYFHDDTETYFSCTLFCLITESFCHSNTEMIFRLVFKTVGATSFIHLVLMKENDSIVLDLIH